MELLLWKNRVYWLICSYCNAFDIEKTDRSFKIRYQKHYRIYRKKTYSTLAAHFLETNQFSNINNNLFHITKKTDKN